MNTFLEKASQRLASLLLTLSAMCLVALMMLTVVEVIGRYAFNAPIFGRQDIAQILLAMSIFLAFPVVTFRGEQIDVDLLDGFFSRTAGFWRDRAIGILVTVSLLTMGYWLFQRAEKFQSRGIASELLFLPKYPLVYFIAATVLLTGLVLGLRTLTLAIAGRSEK